MATYECPAPAGDMHINDELYTWGAGNGSTIQDIQSIALHELGHAFGHEHDGAPSPGQPSSSALPLRSEHLEEDANERIGVRGLGDVSVEAGLRRTPSVLAPRVGGERHGRNGIALGA